MLPVEKMTYPEDIGGDVPVSLVNDFAQGVSPALNKASSKYSCVPTKATYRTLKPHDRPCPPEASNPEKGTLCCASTRADVIYIRALYSILSNSSIPDLPPSMKKVLYWIKNSHPLGPPESVLEGVDVRDRRHVVELAKVSALVESTAEFDCEDVDGQEVARFGADQADVTLDNIGNYNNDVWHILHQIGNFDQLVVRRIGSINNEGQLLRFPLVRVLHVVDDSRSFADLHNVADLCEVQRWGTKIGLHFAVILQNVSLVDVLSRLIQSVGHLTFRNDVHQNAALPGYRVVYLHNNITLRNDLQRSIPGSQLTLQNQGFDLTFTSHGESKTMSVRIRPGNVSITDTSFSEGWKCTAPYNPQTATLGDRVRSCTKHVGGVFDNVRRVPGGMFGNRHLCVQSCYN